MDAFLNQLWIARWPLVDGLLTTLQISLAAIVIGTIIGVLVGVQLTYGSFVSRIPFRLYVEIMRGTPVLVSVLAAFYIPSVMGLSLTAKMAGILALSFFAGAHIAELTRGSLQSIPVGQIEAGRSIGLTFRQIVVNVLFPQALRSALPPWINTGVELIKGSSLLSLIGVAELLLNTQEVIGRNFMAIQFYVFSGCIYLVINIALDQAARTFDRR
ncbi:amino acid ABC transporter permease [Phyllobacterium sp. SB3]|uniref:amino acid ABC transporter permease n=1 Tax=Phyllobacterium sp. SB3 TaxID=3156073 RepID=UPI0032AF4A15